LTLASVLAPALVSALMLADAIGSVVRVASMSVRGVVSGLVGVLA